MMSKTELCVQPPADTSFNDHFLDMKDIPVGNAEGPIVTVVEIELTNEESPKPVKTIRTFKDRQRQPLPRLSRAPILNPTFSDLVDLALARVVDIVVASTCDPPPRLFPHSEHLRHTFFPVSVWDKHGDMETESGQLSYMLSEYPERCVPLHCSETIQGLLSTQSPLRNWLEYVAVLRQQAERAKEKALEDMCPRFPEVPPQRLCKEDFWRDPTSYPTNQQAALDLWHASLAEIASDLESGKIENIGAFLEVHAFLRDPIGGLTLFSAHQIMIFFELWHRTEAFLVKSYLQVPLSHKQLQQLAAQLAVESSFLSIPSLQKINHIHFSHHHQLCYVYTTISHLRRAEFSIPDRVLEILSEILITADQTNLCALAPIAIAYAAPMDSQGRPFEVIIDGNNRLAALTLLRFLATQIDPSNINPDDLYTHCIARGLGPKWLIDLREALASLLTSQPVLELVRKHWSTVRKFANVSRVPALVVQEQNFFTLCLRRSTNETPILLQPMHQTFYNDDRYCIAFRAKGGQAHGRTLGFAVLPIM